MCIYACTYINTYDEQIQKKLRTFFYHTAILYIKAKDLGHS